MVSSTMIKSLTVVVLLSVVNSERAGKIGTDEEYDAHPSYKFEYAVADPVTGDTKSQVEARDGDSVQGVYQVLEPTGNYRTVEYAADAVNGFVARVSNSADKKGAPGPQPVFVKSPGPVPIPPKIEAKPVEPAVPQYSGYYPYSQYYQNYPYSQYYQNYPYSQYYQNYPYSQYYNQYPYSGYYPYNSQYYKSGGYPYNYPFYNYPYNYVKK